MMWLHLQAHVKGESKESIIFLIKKIQKVNQDGLLSM